jgi:hypothetical protein
MGALGVDLPRRDLFVSPRHGMLIGDVLVAAVDLVNGVTITQPATTADVEYFHPELATHDIILAEGAPSESFIDDDSRTMFHNVAEYRALYPDAIRRPARYCRPRVEDGEALEDIRRRLAAGPLMDPEAASPALPPLGSLDVVNREKIDGWALDETRPDTPVRLRIHNNDVPVAEIAADRFRPDLNEKGIGDRSFSWTVPGGLSPMHRHVIRVRRVCDGAELPGSPWVLEPEEPLPPAALPTPGIECAGGVDSVTRERLTGWARDEDDPANPVALSIFDNGMVIARVLANRYRFDLRAAGIGEGRHSFDVTIPGGLTPLRRHVISIKRDRDGAELHGSPIVIDAASTFDAALERSLADAVTALGSSGAEAARVLEFMAGQMSRLCDLRAGVDARREARHAAREFHRRWGPGADGAGPPPRALVIDDRIPIPGRDAGSNVVLSHMRALRCLGYEVGLAAAEAPAPVGSAPTALADAGIGFFGEPFYASIEDVLRRQTRCFDVIYLHRAGIAERYLALARTYCPDARIIYSIADLHHLRLARQAEVEGRPELAAASRRMRITEKVAALSADAVITHSPVEMALLREDVPQAAIYQVPWSVPARPSGVPVAERSGVAFIGGYGHAPNVDAAWWLVREVMPLVWRVHPSIGCLLVGTDMPPAIRGLAGPGVRVAGAVGDLAADVFRRVRLTVAPLRFGAGIKGKVLDSFAAGVPCAMSEIAAEGLDLPPVLRSLTAADAATLAAIMLRLHDDEIANEEAARAGLALIERDFSDDATVAALGVAIGVAVPAAVKQAEPTNA